MKVNLLSSQICGKRILTLHAGTSPELSCRLKSAGPVGTLESGTVERLEEPVKDRAQPGIFSLPSPPAESCARTSTPKCVGGKHEHYGDIVECDILLGRKETSQRC